MLYSCVNRQHLLMLLQRLALHIHILLSIMLGMAFLNWQQIIFFPSKSKNVSESYCTSGLVSGVIRMWHAAAIVINLGLTVPNSSHCSYHTGAVNSTFYESKLPNAPPFLFVKTIRLQNADSMTNSLKNSPQCNLRITVECNRLVRLLKPHFKQQYWGCILCILEDSHSYRHFHHVVCRQ